jgi:ABC-type phosphate transport system substrate-binding protein
MLTLSARRLMPACILAGAAVAAATAPGAASAAELGTQCSGVPITGQGASVLKLAFQSIWGPDFNSSSNARACNGSQGSKGTPAVSYTSSSSGAGLESWGADKGAAPSFGATNAFVGTEEPPSPTQKAEIEAFGTSGTVETIPVLQEAITVIVNLPSNCQATSKSNPGRLVLNNSTLQSIFVGGTVKQWSQITENGDKLSTYSTKISKVSVVAGSTVVTVTSGGFPGVVVGQKATGTDISSGTTVATISGNELTLSAAATKTDATDTLTFTAATACNPETPITPVVRKDSAGTTHILKRYLGLINSGTFETETGGTETWDDISQGSANTVWPKAADVARPANKGDTEEIAKVAATPGSIGYASLADARVDASFVPPLGGAKQATFWVPIQDNGVGSEGVYADPASNKEIAAKASANCTGEEYTDGIHPFPPPSVLEAWNEVTTETTEKKYTLCGFAFTLALTDYQAYSGTSLEETTTVNNFLRFILETKTAGGQLEIANQDYLALPKGEVLTEAQKGAERVEY